MPVDKNQGSNTAPAYSWYMYQHRSAFVAPRETREPSIPIDKLDQTFLDMYASELMMEKQEWEQNTKSFASLLKQKGNVVYHPKSVVRPGYCTPSLVVSGPAALSRLVGADVGDRVKSNAVRAFPLKPSEPTRYPSDSDDSSYEDIRERLSRQARRARRAKCGVITSIDDDRVTELSVLWDNGEKEHGIWCGKKGSFALIYD